MLVDNSLEPRHPARGSPARRRPAAQSCRSRRVTASNLRGLPAGRREPRPLRADKRHGPRLPPRPTRRAKTVAPACSPLPLARPRGGQHRSPPTDFSASRPQPRSAVQLTLREARLAPAAEAPAHVRQRQRNGRNHSFTSPVVLLRRNPKMDWLPWPRSPECPVLTTSTPSWLLPARTTTSSPVTELSPSGGQLRRHGFRRQWHRQRIGRRWP